MKRRDEEALDTWLATGKRRPLVLRGARQVGKTWLVRDLASRSGRRLIELKIGATRKILVDRTEHELVPASKRVTLDNGGQPLVV